MSTDLYQNKKIKLLRVSLISCNNDQMKKETGKTEKTVVEGIRLKPSTWAHFRAVMRANGGTVWLVKKVDSAYKKLGKSA